MSAYSMVARDLFLLEEKCPTGISLSFEGKLLNYADPWWHFLGLKFLRERLERRLSQSVFVSIPGGRN